MSLKFTKYNSTKDRVGQLYKLQAQPGIIFHFHVRPSLIMVSESLSVTLLSQLQSINHIHLILKFMSHDLEGGQISIFVVLSFTV